MRGLNENTNGLIRQYLKKCCDFSNISEEDLILIMDKLNYKPRKKLGYATPNDVFNKKLMGFQHIAENPCHK